MTYISLILCFFIHQEIALAGGICASLGTCSNWVGNEEIGKSELLLSVFSIFTTTGHGKNHKLLTLLCLCKKSPGFSWKAKLCRPFFWGPEQADHHRMNLSTKKQCSGLSIHIVILTV